MVPALAQGVPGAPRRTSPEDDASRPTHLSAPADGTILSLAALAAPPPGDAG
ncbi:MAG: hypothetical protein HGA21_06785 [Burkholderiaceae bacterium]|nr:hypothetical protein [Burkholderiaceae bacterium]